MKMNMAKELAALGRMTVTQLREKHVEVFGEATRSGTFHPTGIKTLADELSQQEATV